jgi:hypothetical protein
LEEASAELYHFPNLIRQIIYITNSHYCHRSDLI